MSTLISLEAVFGAEAAEQYQRYVCPECDKILEEAVQTNCGHFLCDNCAGFLFYTSTHNNTKARCPQLGCNKVLLGDDGTEYFPDRHLRREIDKINELQVSCCILGCAWNGCYKDFATHREGQHPGAVWQSVPKRKASHAIVTIQDKQVLDQTPQALRETADQLKQRSDDLNQMADHMTNTLSKIKYVDRLKADSLQTSQKKAGAEASSNQSLKRADEPKLFQGQSNTLDAATACDQIRFETNPETELQPKEEVLKKGKHQLVHGSSKRPSHQRNPSDVVSKLPSLAPLVAEAHQSAATTNASAGASPPRRNFPANRRRNLPNQPPRSPIALVPTHRPPTLGILPPLSPTAGAISPSQLPTLLSPQAIITGASAMPGPSPTAHKPPPAILSTTKTPVPRVLRKTSKKGNSLPQDSSKCCLCTQKDNKIKILKNACEELLKENFSPSCACDKKRHRNRMMSL